MVDPTTMSDGEPCSEGAALAERSLCPFLSDDTRNSAVYASRDLTGDMPATLVSLSQTPCD
jgi:hypothetical protein